MCLAHGGRTKRIREKARARLDALAEPAIQELKRIIESSDANDADKLRAVENALDRVPGFGRSKTQTVIMDGDMRVQHDFPPEVLAHIQRLKGEHDSYVMRRRAEQEAARLALADVHDAEVVAE